MDAAALTVGVEEEFLLLDPQSLRPVSGAEAVLNAAVRSQPLDGTEFQRELLTCQIEAASGVCRDLDDLGGRLTLARRRLADLAHGEGFVLASSGTPVCPGIVPTFSPGARYERVARTYAQVVSHYEVCGCHVHVGVEDEETAVAVVNHLRPWLPTLLALSANSPFAGGRRSGHASWRVVEQSRFPGAGIPPWFKDATAYRDRLAALVECGVLVDRRQTFWMARPSPHLPTVEFRVADAAITEQEALLQAALSRALVATALADLAVGRTAEPVDEQICAAAVWTAARYGLSGPAVHPFEEGRVPVRRLVAELLARLAPALEDSKDLAAVRRWVAALEREGTGSQRQLRAAERGPAAVVDLVTVRPSAARSRIGPGSRGSA